MIGSTNAIVVSGGSEAQLYDTRILSQANADSGWAYMCSDNYRSFSSSTLPTLYNDMNSKLSSAIGPYTDTYVVAPGSSVYQQLETILQNSFTDTGIDYDTLSTSSDESMYLTPDIVHCNNKFFALTQTYYITDLYIYENNTWYDTLIELNGLISNSNGTLLIGTTSDNSGTIYKIDPTSNANNISYKAIATNVPDIDIGVNEFINKEYNDIIYFKNRDPEKWDTDYIYSTISNYSDNSFNTYSFDVPIYDFVYANGYWYLMTADVEYSGLTPVTIYKGTDLSNSDLTDTTKWQVIYQDWIEIEGHYNYYEHGLQLFYSQGRFVIFAFDYPDNTELELVYFYTDDEFNTVSNIYFINNFVYGYRYDSCDKVEFVNNCFFFSNKFCYLLRLDSINNWKTLPIPQNKSVYNIFNPVNSEICISIDDSSGLVGYCDIYTITVPELTSRGIEIGINYKKYENFKICTYSDLTTLNTLYNQYGVSNYWNIYNNAISIPVNKQEYSVMYVGSNFNDNLY